MVRIFIVKDIFQKRHYNYHILIVLWKPDYDADIGNQIMMPILETRL